MPGAVCKLHVHQHFCSEHHLSSVACVANTFSQLQLQAGSIKKSIFKPHRTGNWHQSFHESGHFHVNIKTVIISALLKIYLLINRMSYPLKSNLLFSPFTANTLRALRKSSHSRASRGHSTVFPIKLPLSLHSIQAEWSLCVFEVGSNFAAPLPPEELSIEPALPSPLRRPGSAGRWSCRSQFPPSP